MYDNEEVAKIVPILKSGGVALFPTDTIWGLGCDAFNKEAVDQIYEIKNRPKDKPFILLIDSLDHLQQYVPNIHPKIINLIELFERPLTVVYPEPQNLPDYLLSSDGSIAIRIIKDSYCQEIIEVLKRPLISTSANLSTEPNPKSFRDISQEIIKKVDFIANHRREDTKFLDPSVIVTISGQDELIILRK